MPSTTVSRPMLWTGRIMSALPVLIILLGAVMKLMKLPAVVEGFAHAGAPEKLIIPVGLIELTCVVTYVIPRTAVLGAILMTDCWVGPRSRLCGLAILRFRCPSFLGCWHGADCTCGTSGCEN